MSATIKCGVYKCKHRGFGGYCNLTGTMYLDADGQCEHIDDECEKKDVTNDDDN